MPPNHEILVHADWATSARALVCLLIPKTQALRPSGHPLSVHVTMAPASPSLQGGGLRDSFLVDGVAFKKTFSYAGFEMQPRSFTDPLILLLNIELELKAEKENAEVRARCQPRAVAGYGPLCIGRA